MSRANETIPPPLARPLRAVRRRIRLQRALDAAFVMVPAGLGLAAAVLTAAKLGAVPAAEARTWLIAAAGLPVVGAVLGALRPVGRLLPAQLLDRAHGLRSRIANALELAPPTPNEPDPFTRAAIADAEAHATGLEPRRAMPLRRPRGLAPAATMGAGLGLLAAMVPPPPPEPPPRTEQLAPLLLHPDDLNAFESGLDEVVNRPGGEEELTDAAREYNQLLEDLADRRLDRTEALRRISELENRLTDGRAASAEALEESLKRLGKRMERSGLIEKASEALKDADARRAERELRDLAERLRNEKMSRKEIAQLRRDLKKASREDPEEQERLQEMRQRQQELQRLLQRQREQQERTPEEQRLLRRRERELERLRREQQQLEQQQRQLERLRRELERAAEQLNDQQQQQQAGQSLDRGAEDLNRMARQQMSEEQMRRLQQQLRQLRETIRRQRQNGGQGQGKGQSRQMDRFVLRARGQGDGEGTPLLMPGQGEGQSKGGQGQRQKGQGQQGQGEDGKGGRKALRLGQGGDAMLEMPGMGGKRQGSGQGRAQVGPGAGTGHDPRMLDDPTDMDAQHENMRVEGQQAGEGPSRSEVILGASDRGFVTRGYEKVYADYENHAEEVLEQDEVPPGYRFYVRRYFQLIRPREEQ